MGSDRGFVPASGDYAERVRASFGRQRVMQTIGASLVRIEPGEVEIHLPYREDLTQQHGFLHGGVVSTIADSACGYAAYSLMDPDASVLTVEYKINLLAPARGERFVARGTVVKPGRTLTVCQGEVEALEQGSRKTIATISATLITLKERPGISQG